MMIKCRCVQNYDEDYPTEIFDTRIVNEALLSVLESVSKFFFRNITHHHIEIVKRQNFDSKLSDSGMRPKTLRKRR